MNNNIMTEYDVLQRILKSNLSYFPDTYKELIGYVDEENSGDNKILEGIVELISTGPFYVGDTVKFRTHITKAPEDPKLIYRLQVNENITDGWDGTFTDLDTGEIIENNIVPNVVDNKNLEYSITIGTEGTFNFQLFNCRDNEWFGNKIQVLALPITAEWEGSIDLGTDTWFVGNKVYPEIKSKVTSPKAPEKVKVIVSGEGWEESPEEREIDSNTEDLVRVTMAGYSLSNTGMATFQLSHEFPTSGTHSEVVSKKIYEQPVWTGSITLGEPLNEDGNYRVGESVDITLTTSISLDPEIFFNGVSFSLVSNGDGDWQKTGDNSSTKKIISPIINQSEGLSKTITENITFTKAGTITFNQYHAYGKSENHGNTVTITIVE